MYIPLYGRIFGGIPKMLVLCDFLKKLVSDKKFTGLLELIQLYKQKPLEKILSFTIYQNYTLALTVYHHLVYYPFHLLAQPRFSGLGLGLGLGVGIKVRVLV